MEFRARQGTVEDTDRIVDIWMRGIENSLGTPPPAGHDYRAYFGERLENQDDIFRFTIVENDAGDVLGWMSLSPFRSNPAVKGIMAELSAYVEPNKIASGVTGFGLDHVMRAADASLLQYVIAFCLRSNTGALKLVYRYGFKELGEYPVSSKAPDATPLVYLVRACAYREE